MRRFNAGVLVTTLFLSIGCGRGTSPALNQSPTTQTNPPVANVDCSYSFKKANLCASLRWTKTPTLDDDGALKLTFTKATDSTPVDPGYALLVIKRMPEMACPPVTLTLTPSKNLEGSIEPGVFEAPVSLDGMPGKSEIWIRLKNGNTVVDEAKVTYTF
jgi:hypothetical protein